MTDAASIPAPPRRRAGPIAAAFLLLLAIGGGAWWYVTRAPAAAPAVAAISVQTATAEQRAMPVLLQSVGKVVAAASAEVRPQTAGVIRQVFIKDGERVHAGQKLFTLESDALNASLAQAQAQWRRDEALAEDAAAAQARLAPLAEREYVTAREYESAVASTRSLRATAAATRAQIAQARVSLGYATVSAPIDGRAGAVLVKPGNLVAANNGTALVVINALNPVEVAFSLPQTQVQRLREAIAHSASGSRLAVESRDSLTGRLRARGELVFVDNALDDSAGTLGAKARFTNTDEALWPGEFCAVRIVLATDEAAIVVPDSALQQGQSGPYVYVVANGRARLRQLKVDRVQDGSAVVSEGLRAGEAVLTAVPSNLRDGSAVTTASSSPSSPASAASAAVATAR